MDKTLSALIDDRKHDIVKTLLIDLVDNAKVTRKIMYNHRLYIVTFFSVNYKIVKTEIIEKELKEIC